MQSISESSKKIFTESSILPNANYENFKNWCNLISEKFDYFKQLPKFIILLYLILGNELDLLGHNADRTYRIMYFWGGFSESLKKGNSFQRTLQRIAALILFTITSCIILIAAIYFIPHKIYNQKLLKDNIINNYYLRIIITIISIPLGPLIYLITNDKSSYKFTKNNKIELKNILDGAYKTLEALLSWVAQIILSPFFLIISFIYEILDTILKGSNIIQELFQNIFNNIKQLLKFSLIIYIPLASISLCLGVSYIITPVYILTNITLDLFLTVPNQIFLVNYVLINSNFIFLWYKHNPQIFSKDNLKHFAPLYIFTFLLLGFSITRSNSLFIFLSALNQLLICYKNNITTENTTHKPATAFILELIEANPKNITNEDTKNLNSQTLNY